MSMKDFKDFEEPFSAEDYVERLAWNVQGGTTERGPESFDPKKLLISFENKIEELKLLNEKTEKRIEKLEQIVQTEYNRHAETLAELQQNQQGAFALFQKLDDRINNVATKVVHLGDQLEGVNIPRQRAVEAQKLMQYFSEFLSDDDVHSEIFTDPFQLQEAADVIQKLQLIAQELPTERFRDAKRRIDIKCAQIENDLLSEFKNAHKEGDKQRMKELATVLLLFKRYADCVDSFIALSQKPLSWSRDLFADLTKLCRDVNKLTQEVFISAPETVMGKFVTNVYQIKLQEHINHTLRDQSDPENYLRNLYELYKNTAQLSTELTEFKLGSDASFLSRLTKDCFKNYLDKYISMETNYLKEKMASMLEGYYGSLNHQKRQIQTGGLHDLQARFRNKTNININIGPTTVIDYGGEIFLSQSLGLSLLNESKQAFTRCQLLSSQSELPNNAASIFSILVENLCYEHIDYALDIGLQGIPPQDPKTPPKVYFFDVVGEANAIFHLLERQFSDTLVPLINTSPKHTECVQKKREIMEQIEAKIDTGLDRGLNAVMGYVKHILSTEQKKTDFRPESEVLGPMTLYTNACSKVVAFVNTQATNVRKPLDGKNVSTVLTEFGIRFHRTIYEHLQQFTYNDVGGMLAICDVNEYRKCVKMLKSPLVSSLFDVLHALCNLLVVQPENLKQVCTGEQLAGIDRATVTSFIGLRADFKTAKIAQQLK
ncbi:exocyst complex component 5-like [Ptychodera flava]|uniref:exocyst complex component 5-like n=1 Tax=Ptychodera flava TaxID=63121 RepID=UPI00396A8746